MVKRTIDILLAIIGLIFMAPVFPIIGLLIKLDSKGPVLYPVDRVGKDQKPFKMYKFRTMLDQAANFGDSVSPELDPRVTTFGRFLRRTKLNELPQIINIIKNEMTFVGPRPESPDLAELYPEYARSIFSVTPGLVGPNQILNRNEEELYPPGVDSKKFYIEHILPAKLPVDLDYIRNPNIFKDFIYIFLGIKETLSGMLSRKKVGYNRSQLYLFIFDTILVLGSYPLALWMIFGRIPTELVSEHFYEFVATLLVIRLLCLAYFGMHHTVIRFISYHDVLGAMKSTLLSGIIVVLVARLLGLNHYPPLVAVVDNGLLIFFLASFRFFLRFSWELKNRSTVKVRKNRILIYGSERNAVNAYRTLCSGMNGAFEIIGYIDDDPAKFGKRLNGRKVVGNRHHLDSLAKLYKVNEVILALDTDQPEKVSRAVASCQKAGLNYRMFSSSEGNGNGNGHVLPFRQVGLSDMLSLPRIEMNVDAVKAVLSGKTVLVNGTGGALGLELCCQILRCRAAKLVVVERYEAYLSHLLADLYAHFPGNSVVPVLVENNGASNMEQIFREHRPDLVFHGAVRKFAPVFQYKNGHSFYPDSGRTLELARLSKQYGTRHFLMVSSLLACGNGHNPISDSLRKTEDALLEFFNDGRCSFVIARVCDILENRGSIVSIIENQIKNQNTVILPDPETKACLITKESAAKFILQRVAEASQDTTECKLFECNGGQPVPLIKLAQKIAGLHGLKLGSDIAVKYMD